MERNRRECKGGETFRVPKITYYKLIRNSTETFAARSKAWTIKNGRTRQIDAIPILRTSSCRVRLHRSPRDRRRAGAGGGVCKGEVGVIVTAREAVPDFLVSWSS